MQTDKPINQEANLLSACKKGNKLYHNCREI